MRETKHEGRRVKDERGQQDKRIRTFRDLRVYRLAFDTAMEIYQISKRFPPEERYSMTDQVRRSSRSVCSNIGEGWRKRRYKKVFENKISDAGQEAAETQVWLDFALACQYIADSEFNRLDDAYERIFGMLASMEQKSDTFCKED